MRNALRTFVTGLMIFALLINPAVACHYCGWGGYYSYAPAYYYGYGCGGCGGCEVVVHDDCGGCGGCGSCDGVVVEEHAAQPHKPAPAAPVETPAGVRPRLPVTPQQPATVERPVETAPAPVVPPQTPPAVTPAEDLFNGTESTTTPPATETPATEVPVATPPAIEPAAPAETPAETDDLFGPTNETPAEPAAPAEMPATEPAAPAETPATEEPADDLFGGESADSAPAETTPPATETAPTETPAETPAEGTPPAEEETDDIFGAPRSVLREAGGLASNEMRVWIDNTGRYSVNARLIRFLDGRVQLLKDNGRTTTVPLNRLSARDLRFVNRQASAQKATTFQTARASNAMPGLAN